MPVTTIDYTAAGGASTVTSNDVGTYTVRQMVQGFNIPQYDYILIDPAAAPTTGIQTITYKSGGASGMPVGVLTLNFVSGDLESVTKT